MTTNEPVNQQQVNSAKDFIKDLLNKDNIGGILKDFFNSNATTVGSFLTALSVVIEEERKNMDTFSDLEKESYKIYMENLKSHREFLENLLKQPNYNGLDKNDILKMINRILEDMKEERKATREANNENKREHRKEVTKRVLIGAAVASAGVFALAMVFNKGDVSKSLEQAKGVTEKLI